MLAYARQLSEAALEDAAALSATRTPSGTRVLRVAIEQGNCVTTLACTAPPVERAEFEQRLALPRRVAQAHGGQCSADQHDEAGELTMLMVFPLTSRG